MRARHRTRPHPNAGSTRGPRGLGFGHLASSLAAVLLWGATAGCGDAIVVLGDSPGLMRIVAGIPDSPGDSVGEDATRSQLATPLGLAADGAGTVYIADSQNARVLGITSSGIVNTFINHRNRATEPRLREPHGLHLSGTDLLIGDPRGHRVWLLDLEAVEAAPIAGTGVPGNSPDGTDALLATLDGPTGVAVGPNGLVYFSETGAHRVRRIEADGTLVTIAGTGQVGSGGDGLPATEAMFNRPSGLLFRNNVLYIADTGNHKVRRVDLNTGVVTSVAGTGTRGFSGDGDLAIDARLNNPSALTLSTDGLILFIADTGNDRVRIVNFDTNMIATFAGSGETAFSGDLQSAGQTALSAPEGIVNSPLDILFIADTGHHLIWRTAIGFLSAE